MLDDSKHYWVAPDEIDKLLRAGAGWLADHPEQQLVTRRYLAHQRALAGLVAEVLRLPDAGVGRRQEHALAAHELPDVLAPERPAGPDDARPVDLFLHPDREPDRLGVVVVVLLSLGERLHIDRRNDARIMAQLPQLTNVTWQAYAMVGTGLAGASAAATSTATACCACSTGASCGSRSAPR